MNRTSVLLAVSAFTLVIITASAQPGGYSVTARGPDFKVLSRTTVEHGTNRVHRYTELASGMNYQNSSGQWTEAKEQITILPQGGAAAVQGRHKVYFPADIYNGVLEVVTPDGKHLRSRPVGVSYDDGSNVVWIAQLKHSIGWLTKSNQVTYADAFTQFKADLVCTYRRGGFECDLVFRQQPPTPDAYGLSPEASTLQMVTEFFNTQDPQQVPAQTDDWFGLQDNTLKFGKLTMTHGKAFAVGSANSNSQLITPNSSSPVFKSWVHLQGRTFLIEEVPLVYLAEDFDTLPEATNALASSSKLLSPNSSPKFASNHRQMPPSRELVAETNQIQLASIHFNQEPGVVLDYNEINTDQSDFTFESGETYYIPGSDYNFSGLLKIEGGAIIKSSGFLVVWDGTVMCPTTPDHPAIFTSANDNSVGVPISGSSGSPHAGDYPVALFLAYNAVMSNCACLEIRYAIEGLYSYTLPKIMDCRFFDCGTAIGSHAAADHQLHNVLVTRCASVVYAPYDDVTVDGENVTVNNTGKFLDASAYSFASVTNSLFTAVTNVTGVTFHNSAQLSSNSGVYQAAASASYYLAASSSYRNSGTTNIDAGLLAQIRQMTTYAPQDGGAVDTNAPDLGYHYPINEDSDFDGLPDWWEWKWFGDYSHKGSDLDTNGNTLLFDYQNGLNPLMPVYDDGLLVFTNGLIINIFEPKPHSKIP